MTRGRRIYRPKRVRFPLVIKPLREEASRGISQASYVTNEADFQERVEFIHARLGRDAIAEEYVEGRELYVSVLGRRRLHVLPLREFIFGQVPDDEPHLATERAKWDPEYRERWGIKNVAARRIPDDVERRIQEVCKRAYRVLGITGYARFDIRLTPNHEIVILEANPNPDIAWDDEFMHAARRAGLEFQTMIDRIVRLGLQQGR